MATYKVENGVAFIGAKNPPVNALSSATRKGILDYLEKAANDNAVRSIVIFGEGATFPAGADIKEFKIMRDTHIVTNLSTLVHVCNAMEACNKPVIAAVHGTAYGGGCEMAISAHYRVVHSKARFAFPEVSLGILPAATGTQRFPRLVGMKAAADWILSGRLVAATEAQKLGMVDKLVDDNLLTEAAAFARSVERNPVTSRRASQMKVKDGGHAVLDGALMNTVQKSKGMMAPLHCINSLRAAIDLPFDQGLIVEQREASILFGSGQAVALQYAFFAQRAATKWQLPGGANAANTKPHLVSKVAVIGAGTMGTGIAMAVLNAGIPVVLLEQNQQFLDKGMQQLKGLYEGSVKLGRLSKEKATRILEKDLTPALTYDQLKDVDLVIEAVYEDLKLKKEVFKKLEAACKKDTILCTNTSSLSVTEISSALANPGRVVGTHFFVPAYHMQLLESVYSSRSSPLAIATVMALGSRIGKVSVLVGDCPGFVGNRTFRLLGIEATFLVEEGCLPQEVDQVLEDFGMVLGTFKVHDLSGVDVGYLIRHAAAKKMGITLGKLRFVNGVRDSYLIDILYEKKRLGRKTGHGWYKYDKPGGKIATPDSVVEDILFKYSRDNGIERRTIGPQEILERCMYSVINECFRCLEEGMVSKPEDVDTIWLLGYGWPRYLGGPMYYAQQVGLSTVYEAIRKYQRLHPTSPHWVPSHLLSVLATQGLPLQDWVNVMPKSFL